jgi:hypothetical protein
MSSLPLHLQHIVEGLCHDGCQSVREYIAAIEAGRPVTQLQHLNHAETSLVLGELKTIMAVYDRNPN